MDFFLNSDIDQIIDTMRYVINQFIVMSNILSKIRLWPCHISMVSCQKDPIRHAYA